MPEKNMEKRVFDLEKDMADIKTLVALNQKDVDYIILGLDEIKKTTEKINNDVSGIKSKPGERFETIINIVIKLIVTGAVLYILSGGTF